MILDQFGRPAPRRTRAAAHFEAVRNSSARSSITSPARTATRDTQTYTRRKLLELSRYFYQNSPTYVGIIERLVAYVVGTGHSLRARSSDETFNRAADAYFSRWSSDVNYALPMDFLTFQNVVARAMFVDGDVGSCMCSVGNRPYVQQVESHLITDRVNSDWDKPDGVELTDGGRVQGYCVASDDDKTEFTNISARRFILHYFPTRPNQYRGLPLATAALLTVHDLDDILALEKQAVKITSAQTTAITREGGAEEDDPATNLFNDEPPAQSDADYTEAVKKRVEQSHLVLLRPGEDMKSLFCDRPGPAWQGFVEFLCNSIAFGTGIPVSLVLGIKVGGADTRRELATAERGFAFWQNCLCWQLQRVYEYVIDFGCTHGQISVPRPSDWNNTLWLHPPRATVDFGKDYAADMALVRAGLMTFESFCAKNGRNWVEVSEQIAVEKAFIKTLSEKYGIDASLVMDIFKNAQPQIPTTPQSASAKKAAARCKPNQCYHEWGKGGSGKNGNKNGGNKGNKQRPRKQGGGSSKKLKMPDGFEPVSIKTVYERIGNSKGETVIAADGKPARFSKVGIRHFKGKGFEKQIRLQSLDVAIDTVKTGYFYESIIPNSGGMVQTEFIKKYGKKYYYTARRKDSGEIYSWHGLEDWQYNKKMKAYKAYNETGKIQ